MATATTKTKTELAAYRSSQISIAVGLAATGNAEKAEKALVAISDSVGGKEGDKALVLALAKVPGTTMMQILTTMGSRPSAVIPALITPRQLAKALEDLPKKWVTEKNPDYLGNCEEILNGVILRNDPNDGECGVDATAFFRVLEGHTAASVLALALIDHAEEILDYQVHKFDENGKDRIHDSDLEWQTAVYKLRKVNLDLFKAVCEQLQKVLSEAVVSGWVIIQELLNSVVQKPLQVAVTTADEAL